MRKKGIAFLLTFILGVLTLSAQVSNPAGGRIHRKTWVIMNMN